jgi:hypothetical protein
MRKFIPLLLLLSGCAFVHTSTTQRIPDPANTNRCAVVKTHMTAAALFDASTVLNKLVVRGTGTKTNEYAPGTYVGGLNEFSSSTNLNTLIQSVVAGAVQGAVSAAKP